MRLVEQLKAVRMSDGKLAEYREKWDECSETCEAAGCTMPSIKQQVIIFAAGLDFRRYGNTLDGMEDRTKLRSRRMSGHDRRRFSQCQINCSINS